MNFCSIESLIENDLSSKWRFLENAFAADIFIVVQAYSRKNHRNAGEAVYNYV